MPLLSIFGSFGSFLRLNRDGVLQYYIVTRFFVGETSYFRRASYVKYGNQHPNLQQTKFHIKTAVCWK